MPQQPQRLLLTFIYRLLQVVASYLIQLCRILQHLLLLTTLLHLQHTTRFHQTTQQVPIYTCFIGVVVIQDFLVYHPIQLIVLSLIPPKQHLLVPYPSPRHLLLYHLHHFLCVLHLIILRETGDWSQVVDMDTMRISLTGQLLHHLRRGNRITTIVSKHTAVASRITIQSIHNLRRRD